MTHMNGSPALALQRTRGTATSAEEVRGTLECDTTQSAIICFTKVSMLGLWMRRGFERQLLVHTSAFRNRTGSRLPSGRHSWQGRQMTLDPLGTAQKLVVSD